MEATLSDLLAVTAAVARGVGTPAELYLVNRTSHLAEGWTDRVPVLELAGSAAGDVHHVAKRVAASRDIEVVWESPADIVPLPVGWRKRARPASNTELNTHQMLTVRHFDPYGVVLRLIARGDEPDYVAAIEYFRHGWVDMLTLDELIIEMLPHMNLATIAQDAAEFRRKFKGLRQLWSSETARAEALGFTAGTWA